MKCVFVKMQDMLEWRDGVTKTRGTPHFESMGEVGQENVRNVLIKCENSSLHSRQWQGNQCTVAFLHCQSWHREEVWKSFLHAKIIWLNVFSELSDGWTWYILKISTSCSQLILPVWVASRSWSRIALVISVLLASLSLSIVRERSKN